MKLYRGDCIEIMELIPDGSVDMILTDPPYGTTSCKWDTVIPFELMWKQVWRVLKPNGACLLFGSEPFSSALRISNKKKFSYDWYWYKNTQTGLSFAKFQPMRSLEIISVFNGKIFYPQKMKARHGRKPGKNGKSKNLKSEHYPAFSITANAPVLKDWINPRNVLEIKTVRNRDRIHPTQKPVELLEYLINTYTLEGETVLDFTMGSGSTGVACKNLKRNFIGIEKDERYFKVAQERINQTEI